MAALQGWLRDMDVAQFREGHLGRVPLAQPDAARDAIAACDWDVLDRLLAARPDDVLVIARGKLLDVHPPRSLAQLRELFAHGIGVAVRMPERFCPEVAVVAAEFARDLPGEQRVIVFATPGGVHGFGWHYDPEDVFIVQTAGDKSYFFRQNTIDPEPVRGAQPDFSTFRRETSPMLQCRLLAGDWLYLPRGYWHVARPHADALSISIGVFPD